MEHHLYVTRHKRALSFISRGIAFVQFRLTRAPYRTVKVATEGLAERCKILLGDILGNKKLTSSVFIQIQKYFAKLNKTLNHCLYFSSLIDDFAIVKARRRLF